jgi:hypothetical protein
MDRAQIDKTKYSLKAITLALLPIAILLGLSGYACPSPAASYSQIILQFAKEKPFTYEYLKAENSLRFDFPTCSPDDVANFNEYDEDLVRRMLIKDRGPHGTEVKVVLRDRNVRTMVQTFKDPFRVVIDLFNKDYKTQVDPATGLPTLSGGELDNDTRLNTAMDSDLSDLSDLKDAKLRDGNASDHISPTKPPVDAPQNAGASAPTSKRRLLQALPEELASVSDLKAAISKIAPGIGAGWSQYPLYVYRAQLAPYEGREAPDKETSHLQGKAIQSSTGMAAYASKLYDLGHEGRALVAYQQVLLKSPETFSNDPLHLWKFAECQLGSGNYNLADGYYASLIEKHPTHALSKFAALRRLDVQTIQSIQRQDGKGPAGASEKAMQVAARATPELQAQAIIRKAWWDDATTKLSAAKDVIPVPSEDIQRRLAQLAPDAESQRTGFLANTLAANRMTQQDTPWEKGYAPWLMTYLGSYKGPSTERLRNKISEQAKAKLTGELKSQFTSNRYLELIATYENLPAPMKSVQKEPTVSWAIAESYRMNGQLEKAIPLYQLATNLPAGIDKAKALFWLTDVAGRTQLTLKSKAGSSLRTQQLQAISQKADKDLLQTWNNLKSDEQTVFQTALNDAIEANVASDQKTKSTAIILLSKWNATLSKNPPKVSAQNGTNTNADLGNSGPSAQTVKLLDDLGRKFAELGMSNEKRKALELMRFIQPAALEKDTAMQKVWSKQLLSLAEEHRQANEYLEAGELYSLVGDSAGANENRAEANYKGGLLLFRAGKKQEAIKALEKAKSDTNNLFYSKLATERLDQLQAH